MRNSLSLLFATHLAFLVAAPTGSAEENVGWRHDLEAARTEAAASGRLLLMHFWSESCEPCRRLEKNVFNQTEVATAVGAHYVPVKINTKDYPATAQQFGVTTIPRDVIVTPAGQVVHAMTSPATPNEYVTHVTHIAAAHQRQVNAHLATNSAPPPPGTPPQSAPQGGSVNAAYAALAIPPQGPASQAINAPVPSVAPTMQRPQAPIQSPPNSVSGVGPIVTTARPNHANLAPINSHGSSQPPQMASGVTPASGVGQSIGSAVPPAVAPAGVPATTPTTTPKATNAPGVGIANVNSNQPARPAATAPQLPVNSPPLGLDGFCPVTLKEKRLWQRGATQWGVIHRGRTYLFASEAAKQKFFTSPDNYSPVLSGFDPVLALSSGSYVNGRRNFGAEYRGLVYLFSNEETLRQFESNPEAFHMGVRQAMAMPDDRKLR